VFSAGVGLDASVVERVDAHPRMKARLGEWYYTWAGIDTFTRRYLLHPPRLEAVIGDERIPGVTTIVQNATAYTYFGDRPVQMADGATLVSGDLAGIVLERARPSGIPTIIWRALSERAKVSGHRHIHPFSGVREMSVRTTDERPLPLQVDGDYIGDVQEATFAVVSGGIVVVS
jgi:diacylglycerol kinase family enzyme